MNWDRVRREGRERKKPWTPEIAAKIDARQDRMAAFATDHKLSCFKCGSKWNKWAKTGVNSRGPWAICRNCISR